METIAFVAAIVLGIVFLAERLAFAVLVYLLSRWAMRMCRPAAVWLIGEYLVIRGFIRLLATAARRWWTMRALRAQLAGGATP